jgi:hypothetical protein
MRLIVIRVGRGIYPSTWPRAPTFAASRRAASGLLLAAAEGGVDDGTRDRPIGRRKGLD